MVCNCGCFTSWTITDLFQFLGVIMCFFMWLYLVYSLSQEKCCISQVHILAIIETFTFPEEDLEILMEKDVHTILKHPWIPNLQLHMLPKVLHALSAWNWADSLSQTLPKNFQSCILWSKYPQDSITFLLQTFYQPHAQYKRVFFTQDFLE